MNQRFVLSFISLFSIYFAVFAQDVYLSTSQNKIYKLNEDDTVTFIVNVTNVNGAFLDIAISPSNDFYGVRSNKIYEIDVDTGLAEQIGLFPNTSTNPYNSLVCDNNYNLYTINIFNQNLYRYNILTQQNNCIANLGFTTPGDLSIYKGNLIFPSGDYIKSYNLETGFINDIYCLEDESNNIYGLANSYTDCDTNRILASNISDEIWDINIEAGTSVLLGFDGVVAGEIYGLASINEHQSSLCSFEFEDASCSLSVGEYNLRNSVIIYPNPVQDILNINDDVGILSIEIYNVQGKLIHKYQSPRGRLDLSSLNAGVYMLKIDSQYGRKIERLIKK